MASGMQTHPKALHMGSLEMYIIIIFIIIIHIIIQRHNEIRDALGDLASIAYKDVVREPVVREPNDHEKVPALVADLSVRGVWQPQATTFFDV